MAEIEHFVAPHRKEHAKFDTVKDMCLTLFPGDHQVGDGRTISPPLGGAVAAGIINNQTLAYFMARTHAFLLRAGVNPEGLRFRQHLRTEMAHYACDCESGRPPAAACACVLLRSSRGLPGAPLAPRTLVFASPPPPLHIM